MHLRAADSSDVWADLGDAFMSAGKPGSAERSYNRSLQLEGSNPFALYGLGFIAETRRDYASARKLYAQCLANNPAPRCASLARRGVARLQVDISRGR